MYNIQSFIKIKNHNMFRPSMWLSSGEYKYLHVYFELQTFIYYVRQYLQLFLCCCVV
jgi:hypothetical protein